ncbi:malonyl-CoA-acyl carrier protein transacylase beg [Andrena cerasifolii]|uniref:malonyl-CoA-acyl carrier protein transacylase beg n=1 Tax=Andrena cerasifolii TaxID=2819439 RepID=UPI00403766F6
MLQRTSFNKIFPCLCTTVRLGHICRFSSSQSKDENNSSESVNTKGTLKDNFEPSCSTEKVSRLLKESAIYKDANDKNWATTPYPIDAPINEIEGTRPPVDPANTSVLLFPGQGIIKVGMVKKYMHFPAAKELFEIANEILNYDLLKICLSGPQEKLNRTEFNQAATVVTSLAALEKLREERPKVFDTCVATAGYSVGEITALILSGAITFEDGVRLVCVRGKAMQYASDKISQGMMSVLCTPETKVSKACNDAEKWAMDMGVENPVCKVAVFLHTQRKILAGNTEALEYIQNHKNELHFSNINRLPVSGAFHTPLMEPALNSIHKILNSIEVNDPRCHVYSNYKATPYSNLRVMKKYILKQIISPVKWEQCMQNIYSRAPGIQFPKTYDIGSEGRMKTILKLINTKAAESCIII